MSETHGAFYADAPHQGGFLVHGAQLLGPTFSSNLVLTRNALGDYSLNRTAAGAETYQVIFSFDDLKRILEVSTPPLPFQEAFGTSGLTPHPWPPGAQGFPPFKGISQFTPLTTQPPKGIRILNVWVVYNVGVVALTAASLSLNRTTYTNGVVRTVTNLPLSGAALPLANQAGDYVATQTVITPVFENIDLSDITCEFALTMANTGTIRIYEMGAHFDFNMN